MGIFNAVSNSNSKIRARYTYWNSLPCIQSSSLVIVYKWVLLVYVSNQFFLAENIIYEHIEAVVYHFVIKLCLDLFEKSNLNRCYCLHWLAMRIFLHVFLQRWQYPSIHPVQRIYTASQSASCGASFVIGREYIISGNVIVLIMFLVLLIL